MHGWRMVSTPPYPLIVIEFNRVFRAERDAMGDDEYHPISQKGTNLTAAGGIGYTVVDSIDTMLLMGLQEEYTRAREWVATNISFDRDANFNTFEVSPPLNVVFLAVFKSVSHTDDYSCSGWPSFGISPFLERSALPGTCN
jgi:mannosyl-oligosaccharide alpha-1,2-mannosidase